MSSAFEQSNMFDFFGFNTEDVASKKDAAAAKAEAKAEAKKEASTANTEDKPKKKVVGLTGNSKVEFPVTVYGRGFKAVVNEPTTPANINGLLKSLYRTNLEIGVSGNVYYDKETSSVFVNANLKATDDDVLVELGSSNVSVVYGKKQADLAALSFDNVDPDEISVEKVTDKWCEINGEYTGCSMAYNAKTLIATPVANGNAITEFTLPVEIVVSGEVQSLTAENFGGKDKVTSKEVKDFIFGEDFKANVTFYSLGGRTVAEYSVSDSKKYVKEIDYSFAVTNGDAKEKKAAVKYALPLHVYFATLGQNIDLDVAAFDGKTKVTEDEVLEYLKKTYSFLNSKDRQIDVIYCKENNTLSVALISGKKG